MRYYLGIDSSTQGMKGVVIAPTSGEVVATVAVNFAHDLPQFPSADGVLPHTNPLVKHSDPLMWLAALDLLLLRLQASGLAMQRIAAIGGASQQHGTVYLNEHFELALHALSNGADVALADRFRDTLARPTAPIWMDSSTTQECHELTTHFGSRLQSDTGSPAIERFSAAQIRKFARHHPDLYLRTTHLHLVSSFLCSILCGTNAPIDRGDGAGMNLLNLKTDTWDAEIAEFAATGLLNKLPPLAPTNRYAGHLAPYFGRYGLRPGIPIALWSGDNPASLVGTGAWQSGRAVVSLGTSDTFFAALDTFKTDPNGHGHLFGNPAGGCMTLTCFKNGSLARDRVRQLLKQDWHFFDQTAFELTPPGNDCQLALPWFEAEITPPKHQPGLRANFDFPHAKPATCVRAVVEAQALAMRAHSRWIGDFKVLRVTGGAAKSVGICQTLADVFQAHVELVAVADSAALGGAKLAASLDGHPLEDLSARFAPVVTTFTPRPQYAAAYTALLPTLLQLEQTAPL